ncbi:MAG: LLM class flavin-dependent oxidoreductase, partial [Bacteroidota bacterium]|nr:LLM class flavin-dependent oxidoreductase [Bacteroidota bacterium]
NIIAADTDEEAKYLATSAKKFMLGVIRNTRKPLPSPVKSMEGEWSTMERMQIEKMMFYSFIGSKETIAQGLQTFVEETRVNEIIVIANIYDQAARLKSYQLVSEVFDALEVTV